jgi:hypothetical protein
VAPGPVWTGAENFAFIGTQSPKRPARTESLYRLSYPGPLCYAPAPNLISHVKDFKVGVCGKYTDEVMKVCGAYTGLNKQLTKQRTNWSRVLLDKSRLLA